jgi:hypothetical protein
VIGSQAHTQIADIHIAIRDVAIALSALAIGFQPHRASAERHLDLCPSARDCKEIQENGQTGQGANSASFPAGRITGENEITGSKTSYELADSVVGRGNDHSSTLYLKSAIYTIRDRSQMNFSLADSSEKQYRRLELARFSGKLLQPVTQTLLP